MVDPLTVVGGIMACEEAIKSAGKIAEDATKAISWVEKVKKKIGPCKPEIINFDVNYRSKRSELIMSIHVPRGGFRDKFNKIKIPAYDNFQIIEMIDDQFHPVTEAWRMEDNQYVLNANQLPPRSEHFRLTLSGEVSQELLNTLVRIQPSINPNRDDTTDKYWLICHLKDTNILKKWWDELAVRDIAVGVKVTIRRCFSNAIPFDVVERLESMREWRRLGSTPRFDRQEVIRAHRRGIQARRRSVLDVEEIYKILMEIASAKNFEKYVTIDQPYQLFNVEEDKDYDFYPEKMNIDVSTELNYKSPAAKGYLTFKRKEYEESIKTRIEKEKEERSPSKRKKR